MECYGRNEIQHVSKVFSLRQFVRSNNCKNRKPTQAQCADNTLMLPMAKLQLSMKKAGLRSKLYKITSLLSNGFDGLCLSECVLRGLEISAVVCLFSNDQVVPQLI